MADTKDRLRKLEKKFELLLAKQEAFADEIAEIHREIQSIKSAGSEQINGKERIPQNQSLSKDIRNNPPEQAEKQNDQKKLKKIPLKVKSDLEKFIGENLTNKIGVAITVIGIGIGAKYVIENEIITPLTRIILGYLTGLGFLGFAVKLRKKYDNFSAVLLSGSVAISYFITYAAYNFYSLMPRGLTFGLMVLLTALTALAAIKYDKQVVAHIGLVGAYAVPFLLGEGSANAGILFVYVVIINIGILVIAFKKYWKSLYYSAFLLSWIIYFRWFFSFYESDSFYIAFIFAGLFFLIFYIIFLGYKLFQKPTLATNDVILILSNSFFFYGIGYSILAGYPSGKDLLGLFTLANAVVNFLISFICYQYKKVVPPVLNLIAGLALAFLTLAIPVQLDGNWVTLLWAFEASVLFGVGRLRQVPVYEKISYPLMILAFFSIVHDGQIAYYYAATKTTPLFNVHFLTSLLFIGCFGFINKLNYNRNFIPALHPKKELQKLVSYIMASILIFVLYYSIEAEIVSYWSQRYADSYIPGNAGIWNKDLLWFKKVWVINYTLLFLTALSATNIYKIKSNRLGLINLGLNTLTIAAFFTFGLHFIGDLRTSYLHQPLSEYYQIGWFHIGIRYLSLCFVALLIFACYKYVRLQLFDQDFTKPFELFLNVCILWTLSSELTNWLIFFGSAQPYKLGLSILWGCYSLLLIGVGIRHNKKYLRIGAIALFGITLIKLFLYDIATLNTIAKTILFVILGILLLIISFLYNKYKHLITSENKT